MSDLELLAETLIRTATDLTRIANAERVAAASGDASAAAPSALPPPAATECSLCATNFAQNDLFIMSSERFGGSRYGTACLMCKYAICYPCILALAPPVFPCPYCRTPLGAQVGPLPTGFIEWRVSEKKAFDEMTEAHAVVSGAYEEAMQQLADMRRELASPARGPTALAVTVLTTPHLAAPRAVFPLNLLMNLDSLVGSSGDEGEDEHPDAHEPDDTDHRGPTPALDDSSDDDGLPPPLERPGHPSPDSARLGSRRRGPVLQRTRRHSPYPNRRTD